MATARIRDNTQDTDDLTTGTLYFYSGSTLLATIPASGNTFQFDGVTYVTDTSAN